MKQKACIGCQYDFQCAGDYTCTNLGGTGSLANLRCAPPCETDTDCPGKGGGATCQFAKDSQGTILANKVCTPAC